MSTPGAAEISVAAPLSDARPAVLPIVRPRMPELDALRGVAVLLVVTYHGFGWTYGADVGAGATSMLLRVSLVGWTGVNLFFVLSGFLITGILLGTRTRSDYYRRFYTRRALRILPAYLALLAALLIFRIATVSFVALSALFLANVTELFGVAMSYGPLWSLAVEEHFYLLWPWAVRRVGPARLAYVAAAIVLLEPGVRLLGFALGERAGLSRQTWYLADGLAVGALLAICVHLSPVPRRAVKRFAVACAVGTVTLLAAASPYGLFTKYRPAGAALELTVVHLFYGAVIASALLVGSGRWRRLATRSTLAFFGEISYGLYLIHVLVFNWVGGQLGGLLGLAAGRVPPLAVMVGLFAAQLAVAVAIAAISRRYFEGPILAMKDRGTILPVS